MESSNGQDAIVIGAGPAGLAAAATLGNRGLRPVVLERSDAVGASWRERYDELKLNTSRWLSRLPGLRYPRGTPLFPSRDRVVSYLERYVEQHGLDVRLGVEVQRVDRADGGWRVRCAGGDLETRRAVVATGWDRAPHIPAWPGRETFRGELIHAAAYRNAEPYRDRDVLVVGSGCTGAEIAYYAAEGGAARVRLAVRTPPNFVLRSFGIPADWLGVIGEIQPRRVADAGARGLRRLAIGDLSGYGLPAPEEGMYARFHRARLGPTAVDRDVVDAIRDGRIEIVAAVESFAEDAVALADGSRIEPDAVIAATGYRRGLEPLVGHLGVLAAEGEPLVRGAQTHPAAPNLHFVGFDPRIAGTFRQIRLEARQLARAV